ncbi:hypothetical protein N7468_009155 [Penicillium chermesinum]|uniref:Transcription elongation factor n=1 Tax=Penicillium chermesinum TaxID=63820 RepID=A0A9W9TEP8_9EURO|nr:uncharacterized protein N7468_009155 [Penicillium chermesinum]KAJ5219951.1 hypothetical protein N7468_009155 [Penicillium chermesinum]KAJ6157410.1 hypothetical protein N7470_005002 [Penicillium chermesinum]
MDAKEIEVKSKALAKATTQGEPSSTLLDMLADLRKGVQATEELLRSTRVGIIVNKLKQHKSPEVAKQAGELVSKWRAQVNKQKSGGASASRGSSSPRPSQNGSSTPVAATPSSDKSGGFKPSVAPDKRTWKTDGVNTSVTGSKLRDNCTGLIYDGLCFNSTEAPTVILAMATQVEQAAHTALGPESKPEYRGKIRSLYQNLKNKSNPKLRVRVMAGDITPQEFVTMSSEQLMSDDLRKELEKIKKENMNNAMVAQQERSISKSLQCGKCGQRKVTYTEAQTRSADEPMTLFCTCTNCGKSWRQ